MYVLCIYSCCFFFIFFILYLYLSIFISKMCVAIAIAVSVVATVAIVAVVVVVSNIIVIKWTCYKTKQTKMNMISIDRNAVVTRFFLSFTLFLIILSTLKSAHIFVCYLKMSRIASWGHRSPLNSHMSIGLYNVHSVSSENKTTKCIQFISVWCICMCMLLFLVFCWCSGALCQPNK